MLLTILSSRKYTTVAIVGNTAVFSLALTLALAAQDAEEAADKSVKGASSEIVQLYVDKCARCHGTQGEGVAEAYAKPLAGRRSIAELTKIIDETMPEEAPEQCSGADAQRMAEYLYHEFYLPRIASQSARVDLLHLSVDQYRNSFADVIGRFAPAKAPAEPIAPPRRDTTPRETKLNPPPAPPTVGLRGEYYQSKGMSKADELGLFRVDTRMEFDFGEGSPDPAITADQFAIVWSGAFKTDETGDYEFRITTENGARLYLNLDPQAALRKLRDDSSATGQRALIDGWVGSGEQRELTARVFLLGGRVYPLRFEFFKYLEKRGSVKLEFKPPHGVWSVLDHEYTTTHRPPRVAVCQTDFPADDRSLGYERGSAVSQSWQAAVAAGAMEAADEVVNRLPLLAGYSEESTSAERAARIERLLLDFAESAFRRPLGHIESQTLLSFAFSSPPPRPPHPLSGRIGDRNLPVSTTPANSSIDSQVQASSAANNDPISVGDSGDSVSDIEAGVRRAIIAIFMSPHFLYPDLPTTDASLLPYRVAARLALACWDSVPDAELLEAARTGCLQTKEQIRAQAQRLLGDHRARQKLRSFFHAWLELEQRDIAKDKQLFPQFDDAVAADLRRSLDLLIDDIVWSQASDYRQLLLADYLILNPRLRELYADQFVDISARPSGALHDSAFQRVQLDKSQRSGILTHPYLLSAFAYHNNTSPIHRGVFLTRNIVGRMLNPPPMAIAFKDNDFPADLTMREKITQLTSDTACMSCHAVINPLGFTMESFDAIGRWRSSDKDRPLDTTSQYTTATGEKLKISSPRDVAEHAAANPDAHRSFVQHMFQHMIKQDPQSLGHATTEQLTARFERDQFHIRQLWTHIATDYALQSVVPFKGD